MNRISELLRSPPCWLVYTKALLLLAGLGLVDYLTGDYSILVFYLIPVSLVAWYRGRLGGIIISAISGFARFFADFSVYEHSLVHLWNALADAAFLMIVSLLVAVLHRFIDRERQHGRHIL